MTVDSRLSQCRKKEPFSVSLVQSQDKLSIPGGSIKVIANVKGAFGNPPIIFTWKVSDRKGADVYSGPTEFTPSATIDAMKIASASSVGCVDDLRCSSWKDQSCFLDLSTLDSAVERGTLVWHACPLTCNMCTDWKAKQVVGRQFGIYVEMSQGNRTAKSSKKWFRVVDSPKLGRCSLSPSQVQMFGQVFLKCSLWTVQGNRLYYRYSGQAVNHSPDIYLNGVFETGILKALEKPITLASQKPYEKTAVHFTLVLEDRFGGKTRVVLDPVTLLPLTKNDIAVCESLQQTFASYKDKLGSTDPVVECQVLVALLLSEPECQEIKLQLWAQIFNITMTTAGMEPVLFAVMQNAPSVAMKSVKQIISMTSQLQSMTSFRESCFWKLRVLSKLLSFPIGCDDLESTFQSYNFLACQCSQNLVPGETETLSQGYSAAKCLVDPAIACVGLPAGLQLDPGILAQIQRQFYDDPYIGQETLVSVVTVPEQVLFCRKSQDPSLRVASTASSINILDRCRNISVVDLIGTIKFSLEVNNSEASQSNCGGLHQQPQPPFQCRYWSPVEQEWVVKGCKTFATSNSKVFDCSCTHLTDFALFYRQETEQCDQIAVAVSLGMYSLTALVVGPVVIRFMQKKSAKKDTHTIQLQLFWMLVICVLRVVESAMFFWDSAHKTVFFILSCLSQGTFAGLFARVILTWRSIHHCPMQITDERLQNRRVVLIFVLTTLAILSGFVAIALDQSTITLQLVSMSVAILSLLQSGMLAFYGFKVSQLLENANVKKARPKPSDEKCKRTAAKTTYRLSCQLAFLFLLQSALWVVSSFPLDRIAFACVTIAYNIACATAMLLLTRMYCRSVFDGSRKKRGTRQAAPRANCVSLVSAGAGSLSIGRSKHSSNSAGKWFSVDPSRPSASADVDQCP